MTNIKDIAKLLCPIFDKLGYTSKTLSPSELCFVNTSDSINISFDVLGSHLQKIKMQDYELRVRYAMRFGVYWIVIDPKLLLIDQVTETSLFYTNHNELIDAAMRLGKQATNIVLPSLEKAVDFAVFPTDDLYKKLSQIPLSQVAEFSKKRKLEFQATRKNLNQVKSILESWIPDNTEEKQIVFESRIEDIIELAAYIGYTIIKSFGGTWAWQTVKRFGCEVAFCHEYYVIYCDCDGNQQKIDSLYDVLMHWNLGSIIFLVGLQ